MGCSKDQIDPELEKRIISKLDNIEKRLDSIEKGGGARAGAAERGRGAKGKGQRPERPPGPDPMVTYAVPIDGSTTSGPKYAKITLVEAFEFA